jgi:hypothetical protein
MRFFKEMKMTELPKDLSDKLIEIVSEYYEGYFAERRKLAEELQNPQPESWESKLIDVAESAPEEFNRRTIEARVRNAYLRAEALWGENLGWTVAELSDKAADLAAQLVVLSRQFRWIVSDALLPVLDKAPGEPGTGTPRQSR